MILVFKSKDFICFEHWLDNSVDETQLMRKHGSLHERLYPLCPVPSSMDRVGGFMLFCKSTRIVLEGHLESFLTAYIITAFSEH